MALTDEEKAQLAALQQKESEPEGSDDYDIEIWDETGAGAKVPFSQGKTWLARFGIGVEAPSGDGGKPEGKPSKTSNGDGDKSRASTPQRYFGKK